MGQTGGIIASPASSASLIQIGTWSGTATGIIRGWSINIIFSYSSTGVVSIIKKNSYYCNI